MCSVPRREPFALSKETGSQRYESPRDLTSVSMFGTRSRRPVQRAGGWKTQFMVQRYAHLSPDTSGLLSSGCLTRNQGALPHQNWL